MAFKHTNSKGQAYYLHVNVRKLASGKEQKLYFFSKTVKEGALDTVPAGYQVTEGSSGLPFLKRVS
jgi:hypothetical protein